MQFFPTDRLVESLLDCPPRCQKLHLLRLILKLLQSLELRSMQKLLQEKIGIALPKILLYPGIFHQINSHS
jgi:hypothetical protein